MNVVICPGCGRPGAKERVLTSYRYTESGIPNLWLRGGVTETVCGRCKEKYFGIEKEGQLLQTIALGLLMVPWHLSGHEMRFLRGTCQLSQAKLAAILRLRRETIAEREGKTNPRIGFADEVLLRLVFLRHFAQELNERENFLTESQRKTLADFTEFFSSFCREFAGRNAHRKRLVAALDHAGERWKLDDAA